MYNKVYWSLYWSFCSMNSLEVICIEYLISASLPVCLPHIEKRHVIAKIQIDSHRNTTYSHVNVYLYISNTDIINYYTSLIPKINRQCVFMLRFDRCTRHNALKSMTLNCINDFKQSQDPNSDDRVQRRG